MRKELVFIFLLAVFLEVASAQNEIFVVDEELVVDNCTLGWKEIGRFETAAAIIKHCVRKEAYNSNLEFVTDSYFNVLDSGEERCPLGGVDSGVFEDKNGNSVYLCVERGKERVEEFRSEVRIEESCEEGFEQEGDLISITDGEIVHCSKKTESGKPESPLKNRRETVARIMDGQREERSCSGLSKQECSSTQGCSVKNAGQAIPNCGFICEIIRFFLSGFYTGCEGSFADEENTEEEFCVECADKTWSDCIAHVNCKRSSDGGCEASACSGRYNYEGGSFKVPKCRNNNNPDDDGEIEIEYENGIINSEFMSSDKSGKCTSYRIKLPQHTCQRCEQENVEEQEAEGGPVYTSPCVSEFEDEYANVVLDACGNIAKGYVGSAEYLMSDDECEEANKNNNDLAETPRECSELENSNTDIEGGDRESAGEDGDSESAQSGTETENEEKIKACLEQSSIEELRELLNGKTIYNPGELRYRLTKTTANNCDATGSLDAGVVSEVNYLRWYDAESGRIFGRSSVNIRYVNSIKILFVGRFPSDMSIKKGLADTLEKILSGYLSKQNIVKIKEFIINEFIVPEDQRWSNSIITMELINDKYYIKINGKTISPEGLPVMNADKFILEPPPLYILQDRTDDKGKEKIDSIKLEVLDENGKVLASQCFVKEQNLNMESFYNEHIKIYFDKLREFLECMQD